MDVDRLPQGAREELLRRAWYVHDARWFAAVTAECGIETANRLNRAAVRAVGEIEAGRLARALGKGPDRSLEGLLDLLHSGLELYIGAELMDMGLQKVDDHSYEVHVRECFVATNVTKAGIADVYECAVWDRVHGYHQAVGQSLVEGQLPASTCPRARGEECRRVLTIH